MIFYRVSIFDDFRAEHNFIEYKDYGSLQIWGASQTSWPRTRQRSDDAIHVFLNWEKQGVFTQRAEAEAMLRRLLSQAPVDLSSYLATLLRSGSSSVG